jgi:transcriptional regulator with XRE-family HTH domain
MDGGHYVGGHEWSADDDKRLADLWRAKSKERIIAAFPGRSWVAIGKRAADKGLRRSRSASARRKPKLDKFFATLREIREARGITREELASRAGFHRIHFARVELGDDNPSWAMVRARLGALGYDIQPYPIDATERKRGSRTWLTDEENILRELLAQGSTIPEASLALKRPPAEVEKRALTLGILESEAMRNVSGMTKRRLGA